MTRSPNPLIATLLALLMFGGACSAGSDSSSGSADSASGSADSASGSADSAENASESTETEEATGGAALSCDEAGEASLLIRSANGWLPQVVDAASNAEVGATYDGALLLAAIETLRAIQDVEGPLGTMREGLDNMEADVIAITEGRFDDKVGGYGITEMNGVIGEEIC